MQNLFYTVHDRTPPVTNFKAQAGFGFGFGFVDNIFKIGIEL